MAEVRISDLTEITEAQAGDFFVIEVGALANATRRIQQSNILPKRGTFTLVSTDDVDILNTRMWLLDAADGKAREITVRDLVFGNYQNNRETSNFTLTPGTHNIQAVELDQDGSNSVTEITLDGNTTGIAGCDFYLVNMRASAISVTATNIIMNVNGVASNGIIGAYKAATITVKNDGTRAIFSGG